MAKQKQLILLSGPPRSGKDEACRIIRQWIPDVCEVKMSADLKAAGPILTGLSFEMLESRKDEPIFDDSDATWRDLQIAIAENVLKPLFGLDYFGKRFVDRVRAASASRVFICSDSGFSEECEPLLEEFGASNITLIHLQRDGKTFAKDSRNYVHLDQWGIRPNVVENNGTLADLEHQLAVIFHVPNI